MIVLDASVLIAHLGHDSNTDAAFAILETEDEFTMHQLTQAELLVGPARIGREFEAIRVLDRLGVGLDQPAADEPLRLARLRAQTGLKLPDCCVLSVAERTDAALATFDRRLADAAREQGLDVLGA